MAEKSEKPFAKDFGYLHPFLEKVLAHAGGIEGARGERLRGLLGEERARWSEIEALLAGAEPAPAPPVEDPAREAPVREASAVAYDAEERPVPREEMAAGESAFGLTVGSLRGDRRKPKSDRG